ncbi:MAG TPA: ParA family protein [Candidatus Hydrogenedentes bacterium]|nr:ParA family protein [Candidatus Hydrogenedentota bacterium]
MPIISIVNLKGGCGKSTTARCLAHSKAFRRAYKRIALVELDPQGTLAAWSAQRDGRNWFSGAVTTNARDYKQAQSGIKDFENIAREIVNYGKP